MSSQLSSLLHLPTRQPDTPVAPHVTALSRSLGRLSRRTRQIFLLSRLDGMPYADIASFLEVDTDKVERAMLRALQQAHKHEDAQGADPVQEQANRWYVHLQSPATTPSQRIEFRHWLDADTAHLSAFQTSERLWRRLQAPAALLGSAGWHRRKRRAYLNWCLLTAFVCSLVMTAEAFS
ncbi:sigma factor-like helix-turn-helix DNA-binding protein [Pseudomonas sp. NPDC089734]|uniref:sigma factor-like helix-turn-helix DNA-binding protein n=1 Tax=Pseudomonas sp. NPDC089734 TaxID=3364469 RepID=UPI0037F5FC5D